MMDIQPRATGTETNPPALHPPVSCGAAYPSTNGCGHLAAHDATHSFTGALLQQAALQHCAWLVCECHRRP